MPVTFPYHLQILFFCSLYPLDQPFKGTSTPLFYLRFPPSLYRHQEVRIVFNRCLEGITFFLANKVKVNTRPTTRCLLVLDAGTVHVAQPADLALAGLVAHETHGLIYIMRELSGLGLLVCGGCFGCTEGGGIDEGRFAQTARLTLAMVALTMIGFAEGTPV